MADDAQSKTSETNKASETRTSGQGFIPATPAPADTPPPTAGKPTPAEQRPVSARVGAATPPNAPAPRGSLIGDQLFRIEDKTARIEDKYARSEALLARMDEKIENASTRMNDAARQADLAALRSEVRGIDERVGKVPGVGALILTALITSVVTVVLLLAAQRLHLDSYIPQRAAPAGQQ